MKKTKPKIVVIGGGTGTFTVLSGLRRFPCDLTAIVSMADDGGSTGLLRDELGALPPGDIRQCLVALSYSSDLMRELFNYRFKKGTLRGHSFGNILLTALEKMTGSFNEAVSEAGQILAIKGRVIPVTTDNIRLTLKMNDGTVFKGQSRIDDVIFERHGGIKRLSLLPKGRINSDAKEAIKNADIITIGPGSLYTSLVPNLLVVGFKEDLKKSKAKKICICNLVNKPGQTDGLMVNDFVCEIEKFAGGPLFDYIIYNEERPTSDLIKKYAKKGEEPVEFDKKELQGRHYKAISGKFISKKIYKQDKSDKIKRTLIRHDPIKLARKIIQIYEKQK